MKVLVVTAEPVNAKMLRAALGEDAHDAEVQVVSPALNESAVAFWVSDSDEAIADAKQVQEETVERLDEEEDIDVTGDTGESDPLTAIQDALATFPADRIVVFVHPGDQRKYLEDDAAQEAEERFGVPVVLSEVER